MKQKRRTAHAVLNIFLLALLTALLLTGCGNKEADKETPSPSQETLGELSEKLARKMTEGDFQSVYDRFSDNMKKALTPEQLQKGWTDSISDLGTLTGISNGTEENIKDFLRIRVLFEFSKGSLEALFVYNAENQLDGFFLTPVNKNTVPSKTENAETEKYRELSVQIGDSKPLDGKLTLPKEIERPPVIILIQGSGPQDMDETIFENKPFRDLAHGLAEKGIATLRFNKRTFQSPKDLPSDLTIEDEVIDDVRQALEQMTKDERVDNGKIFLLGHSLGGFVAPVIAKEHPEVAGLISMAGSPRPLEDIMMDQIREFNADNKTLIAAFEEEAQKVKRLTEPKSQLFLMNFPSSYWWSLKQLDHANKAKELSIPMLFLQGAKDFQVYADVDFEEWKTLLKDKPNVEFILYPELNHLMWKSTGERDIKDYQHKQSLDPQVISDIADWISRQIPQ